MTQEIRQTEKRECPYCHSSRIWKTGITASVKHGKRQRFVCGDCAHSFY